MTLGEQRLLNNLLTNSSVWFPLPGPQMEAYLSPADILFYGGAAGGGKTDLLLGLALTAHRKSIIFRKEYTQLTEIEERSRELLGRTRASYNGQRHLWTGIPEARTLEFGAVKREEFREKYKGRPHDLKGFDEVADFPENVFRFLIGWLRTTVKDQRVRVVCAGNPPTQPEGDWVVRYWAPWLDDQYAGETAVPGELRWFAALEGKDVEVESGEPFEHKGELIEPKSRTFIPARLSDNPHLADSGYRATLQAMPEPLRSKLLYGDFTIEPAENPWQLISARRIKESWNRWEEGPNSPLTAVGVDPSRGGNDETVIAKYYGSWVAPLEVYPGKTTPDGQSVATLVIDAIGGAKDVRIGIDIIGIGSAAYDILKEKHLTVVPVVFSEKSYETTSNGELGFVNVRAECYWKLREGLVPEADTPIALPRDNILMADLCAVQWEMRSNGILIEKKDKIRKKLGRSPNRADAVAIGGFEGQKGVFFA